VFLKKYVESSKVSLKSGKNNGYFYVTTYARL